MSKRKISIITPSFNQGAFLEETILSVLNQNYANLEYIIIDGGSSDNSVEIIKKYSKQLAYWVSEKDSGQSEAINKGFKKATGEIVGWINSDDILMPGSLATIAGEFDKDPELAFLNGYTVIIDQHSKIITSHFTLPQKKWYAKRGIYYVNQPSMYWKTALFSEIGLLKEDFHTQMDKELMIRIFNRDYKIGQTKEILSGFRYHSQAKSARGSVAVKWHDEENELLRKMYGASYGRTPRPFFKLVYGMEKLLRGIYVDRFFFTRRWKGRHVKELKHA